MLSNCGVLEYEHTCRSRGWYCNKCGEVEWERGYSGPEFALMIHNLKNSSVKVTEISETTYVVFGRKYTYDTEFAGYTILHTGCLLHE